MAESQPVPIDSLNSILVYLDIERRSYEDHKDDRQFDHVFRHATKVREWLSRPLACGACSSSSVTKEYDHARQ
jgi:hypothetical protein